MCGATEQAGLARPHRGHRQPRTGGNTPPDPRRLLEVRSIAAELDFAADELTSCQAKLFTEMYAAPRRRPHRRRRQRQFFVSEAAPPATPRDAQQQAAAQTKARRVRAAPSSRCSTRPRPRMPGTPRPSPGSIPTRSRQATTRR
ncbi:hypothetical protein ACU686_39725 [Yinghuangia aomiensis]